MKARFFILLSFTILGISCSYQSIQNPTQDNVLANLIEKTGQFQVFMSSSVPIDEKGNLKKAKGTIIVMFFHCIEDGRNYYYEELKNCQYDVPKEDISGKRTTLRSGRDHLYLVKGYLAGEKIFNNVVLQKLGLDPLTIFKPESCVKTS